jgi:bifunctional DNase/RNase
VPLVECELNRVILSETQSHQIIVLKEKGGERAMRVLIGPAEAVAIHRAVTGERLPRPMTHELFGQVLDALGAAVEQVVINDLHDGTFFGRLILQQDGHTYDIDSRPSDAVALAVQKGAPIFVEEVVLAQASKDY